MNYEFREQDVLLPYQKRWIADESPLKIAEKSRRTGITWAEAADAALTASKSKAAGALTISMWVPTKRWRANSLMR